MSNHNFFSDLEKEKNTDKPHSEALVEINEAEEIVVEEIKDDIELPKKPQFSFEFDRDLSSKKNNSDIEEKKERAKSRTATIKMTIPEYRKRLEELNKGAENKNYVLLFGVSGAGKSYIIASLLHFMSSYLNGNTRLNKDIATRDESLLYNQMLEMFSNPERNVGRTDVIKFFELNITYQPEDPLKKPVEITFIDASGENFSRIYDGDTNEYVGELPDYLEVILESDVNCKFAFIYDQSLKNRENSEKAPQISVLKALYDKVLTMQQKYHKQYPKLLLLSKSDKIAESVKKKYGHSAKRYAENELSAFARGFFSERNAVNRSIFYSMGTFTKYDDLDKFDDNCPRRLFDWIYSSITGTSTQTPDSFWVKFKRWLQGA